MQWWCKKIICKIKPVYDQHTTPSSGWVIYMWIWRTNFYGKTNIFGNDKRLEKPTIHGFDFMVSSGQWVIEYKYRKPNRHKFILNECKKVYGQYE